MTKTSGNSLINKVVTSRVIETLVLAVALGVFGYVGKEITKKQPDYLFYSNTITYSPVKISKTDNIQSNMSSTTIFNASQNSIFNKEFTIKIENISELPIVKTNDLSSAEIISKGSGLYLVRVSKLMNDDVLTVIARGFNAQVPSIGIPISTDENLVFSTFNNVSLARYFNRSFHIYVYVAVLAIFLLLIYILWTKWTRYFVDVKPNNA